MIQIDVYHSKFHPFPRRAAGELRGRGLRHPRPGGSPALRPGAQQRAPWAWWTVVDGGGWWAFKGPKMVGFTGFTMENGWKIVDDSGFLVVFDGG